MGARKTGTPRTLVKHTYMAKSYKQCRNVLPGNRTAFFRLSPRVLLPRFRHDARRDGRGKARTRRTHPSSRSSQSRHSRIASAVSLAREKGDVNTCMYGCFREREGGGGKARAVLFSDWSKFVELNPFAMYCIHFFWGKLLGIIIVRSFVVCNSKKRSSGIILEPRYCIYERRRTKTENCEA